MKMAYRYLGSTGMMRRAQPCEFSAVLKVWPLILHVIYQKIKKSFIRFPNTEKRFEKTRNQLRGVWKSDETLFRVFDRVSQTINNSWRNSTQELTKFYDNSDHFSQPPSRQ